MFRLIFLLM
ncbi:hypothetical protein RDI58_034681 [Solanum bulbocastanum]|uniref:Uncharacterized protein n=1 Tax=Solanum bulbocastanum TaxID=147425 RepID=A0AAN8SFM2_SOLBU